MFVDMLWIFVEMFVEMFYRFFFAISSLLTAASLLPNLILLNLV